MIPADIRNILIVNRGGIGDFLLSFPALKALRRAYPQASFDLLAMQRLLAPASDLKMFRAVYPFSANPLRLWPVLSELRRNRYDLAVNMRTLAHPWGAVKMAMIFSLIHPRSGAGRDTEHRGFFLDIKVPEKEPGEKYEMEYDIDTAQALGARCEDRTIELPADEASARNVSVILKDSGVREDELLVAVHPGGMASRRWPVERFAEAMELIGAHTPCRFLAIGASEEKELCARLCSLRSRVNAVNLAGKLDLRETVELLRGCRLAICDDSGPMHIAACLGIPLVAIFGPGQLVRFDPRKISRRASVVYKPSACAPCAKKSCGRLSCLKAVTAGEVAEEARKLLDQAQR
jgi:lipopolysaccharide heptosyltransferase II